MRKWLTVCCFIALTGVKTAAAGDERTLAQPIRDLHYGEALFDFYQDRYFSAITRLLVAEKRAPITQQGDEAGLLLGALYLSYGLHDAAADIFTRLLDKNQDPATRDRAWFYLGKLHYIGGHNDEAIASFSHIGQDLPPLQEAERRHLLANAYINLKKYPESIETLEQARSGGIWKTYAQYNLGIALIRAGRSEEGKQLLHLVGKIKPRDEEEYALHDKANVALGYASLRAGNASEAAADFLRVSLHSPYTTKALLGLGWAYSNQQKPQEALAPWLELVDKPATDSAAQEALLMIPYALEKLKARELASSRYADAINAYERELAGLDTAIKAAQEGVFIRALRPATAALTEDWTRMEEHKLDFPSAVYLSDLLASRELQQAYRDYRDLLYMQQTATHWQEKIPILQMMLVERRQNYESRLPRVQDAARLNRLDNLYRQREALTAAFAEIEAKGDAEGLATLEERTLLAKLAKLRGRLAILQKRGIDVSVEARKVRILYGTLHWRLADEYPARLWSVKKGLRTVDTGLEQCTQAKISLESAWQNTSSGFTGFTERISTLETGLNALGRRLNTAIDKQEQKITGLVSEALTVKKRRVEAYRLRAQYALARLNDELIHEKSLP